MPHNEYPVKPQTDDEEVDDEYDAGWNHAEKTIANWHSLLRNKSESWRAGFLDGLESNYPFEIDN